MPKKILVVDDDPDILLMLGARLQSSGYEVRKVLNGDAALKAIESESPDLILLDIMMPGMEGNVLARTLKESPRWKEIPVIFMTALRPPGKQQQAGARVGSNIVFSKPFEFSELLETIQTLL